MVDVVEGLFGRAVPAGASAEQTKVEHGAVEVDGLVTDASGTKVHVEFQTRADPAMGLRMARYWTALMTDPALPPPDQHLVLLHPDADRPDLGVYTHGTLHLTYGVTRLWEVDPALLLARPGLARFAPLGQAATLEARAELVGRAARLIRDHLARDQATATVAWMGQLATLYLDRPVVADVLERNHMPIDLSHTNLAIETRRDDIRQFVTARFADETLARRAAGVSDDLFDEAVRVSATATAAEMEAWLDLHQV